MATVLAIDAARCATVAATSAVSRQPLAAHRWQPRETARHLGISRPSLYFLLDAFPSVRKAMDLSREEIVDAGKRCADRVVEMAALLRVSEAGLRRRMKQLGLPRLVAPRS